MRNPVQVALGWTVIDWNPDDTWKKTTFPALQDAGISQNDIDRCVYVIRLNGDFCIQYPNGESPTVYIGEGNFGSRVTSHRKWAAELKELVGEYSFQVCVATPRVKNNDQTYKDCEAVLLDRFGVKFSSAPLWNKQFESRRFPHHVYSEKQVDYAISKRSGAKYKWAIQPMPSSPFHRSYGKTHF
jgi:hypothetical protein